MQPPERSRHQAFRDSAATGAAAVALVVFLAVFHGGPRWLGGPREQSVASLDPAQVLVLRTPGGFLEVSTLVRHEEFQWRSSYTCLGQECPAFAGFGSRTGRIRVPVHYTYRIPLAETWTLRPDGDAYVLSVPPPVASLPPAIETAKAEFASEKQGLWAPGSAGNQANLLRHLGPELAQRAQRIDYVRQQLPAAEATVREFAHRWMKEQLGAPPRPVRVEFRLTEAG